MNKKTVKIIAIITIVIGFIFIGIGIYFSSNKKPVENTTNNATLKIDSYGTIKEEANIYLQANKESVLINTISANESVLIMSDKVYTDDDGLEYKKVLYINDKNETFFGYIETSKLETEEDEKSQPVDREKDANKDTDTKTQTDNNKDINKENKDTKKETDEVSQVDKITIKTKGPVEIGKRYSGYRSKTVQIEEDYDDIEWSISDESVATISGSGTKKAKVTGKKAGTATVTAKKGSAVDTIEVIIEELVIPNTAELEDKDVNPTNALITEIEQKEQKSLKATLEPSYAPSKNITYENDKPEVATIDSDGNIKGISPGRTSIIIKGGAAASRVLVTVESLTLPNISEIGVQEQKSLKATLEPSYAPSKNITYKSSNEKVATIDSDGNIKGISPGKITITATNGAVTATKEITVESITLSNISEMGVQEQKSLKATLEPSYAPSKNIVYKSSNTSVATIDDNGNIKSLSTGVTTITATNGIATATKEIYVEDIHLGLTKEIELKSTASLKAQISPSKLPTKYEIPSQNITYKSSNEKVATIDTNGQVEGLSTGKTTITATNGVVTATKELYVESIALPDISEIAVGSTRRLKATFNPSNQKVPSQNITYKSFDRITVIGKNGEKHELRAPAATNATIDENGNLKGLDTGYAEVIATNGIVTDSKIIAVESISFSNVTAIGIKQKVNLGAKVYPTRSTNQNITYKSSNTRIATVDNNGNIEGLSPGKTTITATNGIATSSKEIYVQSITLPNISEIAVDSTASLKATITPSTGTNQDITYESSNRIVATINKDGTITGKSPGKTTITATNGAVTATKEIYVESITLPDISTIALGSPTSLKATITPSTGTNQNITYKSSDTKIATIDKNGNVEGKSPGYVDITATNGIATITKKIKIENIKSANIEELKVGESKNLGVQVLPLTASSKDVTYTSSDPNIAIVDSDGNIQAINKGTVTITTKIKINDTQTSNVENMNADESKNSGVQLLPLVASNKDVTYTSGDNGIATVDSIGNVHVIKTGSKSTITKMDELIEDKKIIKVTTVSSDTNFDKNYTLENYNVAVLPSEEKDYVLTKLDTERLRDGTKDHKKHRLQQFDLHYNSNFGVTDIYYMYPEAGKGDEPNPNKYKVYFTQKNIGSKNVRTMSYANGGHGATFIIKNIEDEVVSVLTDSLGTLRNDNGKYEGAGLKVALLDLNFKNLEWYKSNKAENTKTKSYLNAGSSQIFTFDFGCSGSNGYEHGSACYGKDDDKKILDSDYKSMMPPTAYDNYNDLIAFRGNRTTVTVYQYSKLTDLADSNGNIKLKNVGGEIKILDNKNNVILNPVSTFKMPAFMHSDGKTYIDGQGIAMHRGVVYTFWGDKKTGTEKEETYWFIKGYDIRTGDDVYTKIINYDHIENEVKDYTEIEPEGIQVKTDPRSGKSYVHIGIARVGGEKKKLDSSIYRINGVG